jgi:hypothetical protein
MYTSMTTTLSKLRAYHRGLSAQYYDALRRRNVARARRLYDLRGRVWRAILLREEWCLD